MFEQLKKFENISGIHCEWKELIEWISTVAGDQGTNCPTQQLLVVLTTDAAEESEGSASQCRGVSVTDYKPIQVSMEIIVRFHSTIVAAQITMQLMHS